MGSGRSGLYNGASIPVTKPEGVLCIKVRFNKKKTEGYLLNQDHPTGGSKAKFMREVLGYTKSDSKLFHKNGVSAIQNKTPTNKEITPHGLKYTFHVKLIGKNEKYGSANVVVVVQRDNRRKTYKIVTVIPAKKESSK